MAQSLTENILQAINNTPKANRYLVALSGGIDSVVLLHVLAKSRQQISTEIVAIHVDHGIQQDSASWASWCSELCHTLSIPFISKKLSVQAEQRKSLEALARDARYAALAEEMNEGDILLTAHHQDDQAETILLNLLRGSGLSGLSAMPLYRKFSVGYLARPMLQQSQPDIAAYAKENRLSWIEDPSNRDTGFDRNYLRQEIMPLLQQRWPGVSATLSRSAMHCAEANQLLNNDGLRLLRDIQTNSGELMVAALANLSLAQRKLVMRTWLLESGASMPNQRRLDKLCTEMVEAGIDKGPVVEWGDSAVCRYCDKMHLISRELLQNIPQGPYLWERDSKFELPANGNLRSMLCPGGINRDLWEAGRVEVSYRRGGEQCRPAGLRITKTLKKLLQENRIPPWMRHRQPLIYIDGDMACIPGLTICEPFAAKDAETGINVDWQKP